MLVGDRGRLLREKQRTTVCQNESREWNSYRSMMGVNVLRRLDVGSSHNFVLYSLILK